MSGSAALGAAAAAAASFAEASADFHAIPKSGIARVDARGMSPEEFRVEFVAKNRPALIEHACDEWPGIRLWSLPEYLKRRGGDRVVTADVTPSGLGDAAVAVRGSEGEPVAVFAKPHEVRMRFADVISAVEAAATAERLAAPRAHQGGQPPADAGSKHSLVWAGEPGTAAGLLLPSVECPLEAGGPAAAASTAASAAGAPAGAAGSPAPVGPAIPPGSSVYFSRQCDCFRDDEEAGFLAEPDPTRPGAPPDVPLSLPFADRALAGTTADGLAVPDAVNLWVGSGSATTSAHLDFYENFYVVLSGQKTFTLAPPGNVAFLRKPSLPTVRYRPAASGDTAAAAAAAAAQRGGGDDAGASTAGGPGGAAGARVASPASWVVVPEGEGATSLASAEQTPWLAPDIARLAEEGTSRAYPLVRHASAATVTVYAGQCLFLPAMWVHRVAQQGFTVAVNYWYDMEFDHRYAALQAAQGLREVFAAVGADLPAPDQ
ncbi:hypothetical protein FNF31_03234 [Cafeteria roenbergensis]|uniref:JmjC domain-containing protein n=1 Tax=Cafeteria roenbergensis TaxID=33653 RepID=A0A5A8DB14_CAFRO|nr:hypothetical protein FNF31_03234 [Cafeteria roenbergensis]KAA0170453.1 hypothetical protein FNF28_01447 [Cafeteria roenbergensis]